MYKIIAVLYRFVDG